jgi:CRISPR-associated protein Cas2
MASREISNNRRVYLCTYDVSDDKRRSKLFELLKDHGEHVQYSVFLCSLTPTEAKQLGFQASSMIHQKEDQLLVIDIGPDHLDWTTSLTCLGKNWEPTIRAQII